MSFIVPVYNTNLGNVLVSLSALSEQFKYNAVLKKHCVTALQYFYDNGIGYRNMKYAILEEYNYLNEKKLYFSNDYQAYINILKIALEIINEKFPKNNYPEFYV